MSSQHAINTTWERDLLEQAQQSPKTQGGQRAWMYLPRVPALLDEIDRLYDAERRLAAAEHERAKMMALVIDIAAVPLDRVVIQAHGAEFCYLCNGLVEGGIVQHNDSCWWLRAVELVTPPATVTREQRKRTLDDVDRAIQQDGEYT